jgi:hypothetical protein
MGIVFRHFSSQGRTMPYAVGGNAVTFFPICIFGPEEGRPVQVACRTPNPTRGGQFVRADDTPLHYTAWTIDAQLARRVKSNAHRLLDKAGKRIDSKWFDIPVEWAKKVIGVAARSQRIPLYTDADLERLYVSRTDLAIAEMTRGMILPAQ